MIGSFTESPEPSFLGGKWLLGWWTIARFLMVAVIMTGFAEAAVSWEKTNLELDQSEAGQPVIAVFRFSITGEKEIEIKKVETSCSCTAVKVARRKHLPGAKGELQVVFTPGNRQGLQKKTILVETSDGQRSVLSFQVQLPETVLIQPKELKWEIGGPASAQTVEIAAAKGVSLKVESARSINPGFEAELRNPRPGVYQVEVTPADTKQARRGAVRIELSEPSRQTLYLKVSIENG